MNRRIVLLAGPALLAATLLSPMNAQGRPAAQRRPASEARPGRRQQGGGPTASHVRTRVVTRTFQSNLPLTIPGVGAGSGNGDPASTYPSTIQVGGFRQGRMLKVRVSLIGFSHTVPGDVDVLLVAPGNVGVILMSDAPTGLTAVTGINLTFDQDAPHRLPAPLVSGTFQPLNNGENIDRFPPPAPEGVSGHSLTAFTNRNPNGPWQLFIVDDRETDTGSLAGWSLTIRARVRVPHRHRQGTPRNQRSSRRVKEERLVDRVPTRSGVPG
jgi:subtilisin-like proprotein convertase family protein